MGTPRSDIPETLDTYSPATGRSPADEPIYVPRTPRRYEPPPRRSWRHIVLFLLTVFTTTLVGGSHYAAFANDFGSGGPIDLSSASLYLNGLWYSASILAILGAHEFGHYYACRYYGVDASLPYFLPAPLPLTGTPARSPIRR